MLELVNPNMEPMVKQRKREPHKTIASKNNHLTLY